MGEIHLHAEPGQVAEFVLLPGDPNRSRWIAETFLEDPVLYTENRQLLGYTGTYKGVRVSVQTTGMGCPSAAIVTEEIIRLGARSLLRVGTLGASHPSVRPGDLVIAQASVPNDGTTRQFFGGAPYAPIASYRILEAAVQAARNGRIKHHIGLIMTEDAFYASTPEHAKLWAARGVLGFEMEASAIFTVAAMHGVHAGCMAVASNNIGDPEFVDPSVLRQGVQSMIEVALEAFCLMHQEAQNV